jgi:hypothetical protein
MITNKRHQASFISRLEELDSRGFAHIERWELLLWFSKQKITSALFRDIQKFWFEKFILTTDSRSKKSQNLLHVIKADEKSAQHFMLVIVDRLTHISVY